MKKPQRQQPMGPKAVRGSDAARRLAALMLEAWSGVRTTQSASDAMGVALTRFYQLEARVLQTIVTALEPRPRGRQVTAETEIGKLKAEKHRLQRDVERFQSLYRTSQRSLGVVVAKAPEPQKNAAPGGKRRRGPRRKARGQTVASVLLGNAPPSGADEGTDGAAKQGSSSRGRSEGKPAVEAARETDLGNAQRSDVRG